MKECIQQYYIKDGKVSECSSFRVRFINEGKSIYEVARLSGDKLLFMEDHIDRLFNSLELEGYHSWLSREQIIDQLQELISRNPAKEGNVKFLMNFNPTDTPYFMAYFSAHRYPSASDYLNGVDVICFPHERIEPNKKIWRPEFRKRVARAILQNNVWEALLLDSNRNFPEASRSNIFAVSGEKVITASDECILTGITRKYVLQACMEIGIPVEFRMIGLDEINKLDALFLTSTSLHVLPVRKVDEIIIPRQNNITDNIMRQFGQLIKSYLE